ncbi:MAG: M15 family metallopeptidase [Caulobacterales bacterium]|nr:M15 family metallopeptidase [Caulobacterales bacterium]
MTFALSALSLARLDGVDPRLTRVVKRAIQLTTVDFAVIEGVRSDDQAYRNWGKGRTAAECRAAGAPTSYARPAEAKVTWVRRPLNTRHRRQANGYGSAVDLLPAPYDWKATASFDAVAKAMREAAQELGVAIRWGADWDSDGYPRERGEADSPHFELAQ